MRLIRSLSQFDRFKGPEKYSAQVFSLAMEGDFAGPLTEIARKNPEVSIGSYPRTSSPSTPADYNVKVCGPRLHPNRSKTSHAESLI